MPLFESNGVSGCFAGFPQPGAVFCASTQAEIDTVGTNASTAKSSLLSLR